MSSYVHLEQMLLGTVRLTAIAFYSIAFIMVGNIDTAPLISMQEKFNPSITFFQYRTKWRRDNKMASERFTSLKNPPTNDELEFLHILDDLSAFIKMHISEAEWWRGNHPLDQTRDEADTAIAFFDGLLRKINASREIAQRLNKIESQDLDEGSRRFLDISRRDARRAAAYLGKEERKEYRMIRSQLEDLEAQFELNIAQDRSQVWMEAIVLDDMHEEPEEFDLHPSTRLVAIPATSAAAITLLQNCEDDKIAEQMYRAMYNIAPANDDVLQRLMEFRYRQAKLLGYDSYIEYALEFDTLFNATTVREYLIEASRPAEVQAKVEMEALSAMMKTKGRQLRPWNFLYAKGRLLKERLQDLDLNDAQKYFPYKHVVPSLLDILGELLDLQLQIVEGVGTWHPSVQVYDVLVRRSTRGSAGNHRDEIDESQLQGAGIPHRLCGRLYLDLVDRPDKDEDPNTVLLRPSVIGSDVVPTVCVGGSYVLTDASFFDLDFLTPLFCQLGQGVHRLLAKNSKYHRFNRLEAESDLDEIPGQVLEELLLDVTFLRRIAIDEDGQSILQEYLEAVLAERKIDNGMFMREQVLYSLICVSNNTEDDNCLC